MGLSFVSGMRSLRSLLFFILISPVALATHVPQQDASKLAVSFYYERANAYKNTAREDIRVVDLFEKTANGLTLYYAINISTGGFVIVSADDRIMPVLAYSFENRYEPTGQPAAFERWMTDYEKQVAWAIENNYPSRESIRSEWERLLTSDTASLKHLKGVTKSVPPMINTTWNQGRYYNAFCPADPGGQDGHAWAGCVPTAMGQIMNYYRWPEHGTGSYTYVHPQYGTLSADFAAADYRWEDMPLTLNRYNDAVAELLYHLGVSVDLDYGPGGSGMFNHKAAWSLRNYFKYDPSCEYIFRDTCTQNWKAIILAHLDQNKPLYYAGWADTSNISGHAFVCDGYQDTTYFHFNWGWGGSYDGYFMIDYLTPGGSNFTLDHELIVNFFPDSNQGYPAGCSGTKTLLAQAGTIEDGSGPLNDYSNNTSCEWLIAPDDSVNSIILNFLKFETQSDSDVVIVYDGATISSPVLGTFSGKTLPSQLTSSGDKMLIRFTTNNDTVMPGWLATYSSVIPAYCSGVTTLTTPSGTLGDGSSNTQNYHNNSLCRWKLLPAGAGSVTLHFSAFNLASDDFIDVYELPSGSVLAHLTGDTLPADITSTSGQMFVKFQSNGQHTAAGWDATYSSASGIGDSYEASTFELYPNPAGNTVTFSLDIQQNQDIHVSVRDITGRHLYYHTYTNVSGIFNGYIDLSELPAGIYFLAAEGTTFGINTKLAHY